MNNIDRLSSIIDCTNEIAKLIATIEKQLDGLDNEDLYQILYTRVGELKSSRFNLASNARIAKRKQELTLPKC